MARKIDRILEKVETVKIDEAFAMKCLRNSNMSYRIHLACVETWVRCAEYACSSFGIADAIKIAAISKWPSCMKMIWRSLPKNESFLYATTFHHEAATKLVRHNSAYVRSGCARFKDLAWTLKDDPDAMVRASACQWPEVAEYLKDDREFAVIVARIDHFEKESLEIYTKHINSFVRLACAARWITCASVLVDDFDPVVKTTARKHLEKCGAWPQPHIESLPLHKKKNLQAAV